MKKIFTKSLFIYMLIALLLTISTVFVLQTVITQRNNTSSSQAKLEDVKEKLVSNKKNVESLTENLGENNLAKTRAFADMLAKDPSIANDAGKLNDIKDRLMVNELHDAGVKSPTTELENLIFTVNTDNPPFCEL